MEKFSKIGLGTVQFGLDYGISNSCGQVRQDETQKILQCFFANGGQLLDTAPVYGNAEHILGKLLQSDQEVKIVTKTSLLELDQLWESNHRKLEKGLLHSLDCLNVGQCFGLLVHHAKDLFKYPQVVDWLKDVKQRGLANRIGVSVYNAEEIDRVLDCLTPDLIQLPYNLLDGRLKQTGHLQKLKASGVEVHARSAFLQGLLLTAPDQLHRYFNPIHNHIKALHELAGDLGVSPVQLCCKAVLDESEIDIMLVGVTNQNELQEIYEGISKLHGQDLDFANFQTFESAFLDPSQWRLS